MVNTPLPHSLKSEAKKAAKILRDFTIPSSTVGPDKIIPGSIIAKAKGLAIITVVRVGFLVTARGGSGIVVARLSNEQWSAPSAIGIAGLGGGFEIGAEVTDFVIILNSSAAVQAFSKGGNLTLGGNFSVAAGPIGRNVEADVAVRSPAAIYTYSKTKGLFVGISIEGSYLIERKEANRKFYGDGIRAYDILGGNVHAEDDCGDLYEMLKLHGMAAPSDEVSSSSSSKYEGSGSTWREERRATTTTTTVISKSSKQAAWYGSSDWSDTKSDALAKSKLKRSSSVSQVSGTTAFSLPSSSSYDDTARSLRPYAASGASTAASMASKHGADYWDSGAVANAAVSRGKDAAPKNFDDYWNTTPPPSYAESTVKNREKKSEGTHSMKTSASAQHSRRASEQPMRQPEKAPRAINVGNVSSSTLSAPRPTPPAAKQATSTWHADDGEQSFWCVALFDYSGELPCDLSFREGERIEVLTRTHTQDDWWEGRLNGKVGIFPANYTQFTA